MNEIVIDDPHGFETVYSNDPSSPAAPYIREYHPRTFEDLYEIGVIPWYVERDHLRSARDAGLRASVRYMDIKSLAAQRPGLMVAEQRRFVEARSNSIARDSAADVMVNTLVGRHGYSTAEAMLLAKKVLSFEGMTAVVPVFRVLQMAADLVIRTPLVIDSSINLLLARAVRIYKTGEVRVQGSYFLLKCDSIQGELQWWQYVVGGSALASFPSRR